MPAVYCKPALISKCGRNGESFMQSSLRRIKCVLGPEGWVDEDAAMAPYLRERRGRFVGRRAELVALPRTADQVAAVVRLAHEAGIAVVPQSGNTGLCGGAVPAGPRPHIILSLRRLDRVREVDAENFTITVEAGCRLSQVQAVAEAADRYFPLSLASQDEAQIGGNLATNAGGLNVVQYGVARDLTLGVEVVLADGQILPALSGLRKDNSGYDLKQLFIGAEGSLGIITAATLKLLPRPRDWATAMVGLAGVEQAVPLLARLRAASGDRVVACELMSRLSVEFTLRHIEGCEEPLARVWPWYLLVECRDTREHSGLGEALGDVLNRAVDDGGAGQVRPARDRSEAQALWRIRKNIHNAQRHEGGSIKHDISVPVSKVPAFIHEASARVTRLLPTVRVCAFGHVGDGNIHFNLSQPPGADTDAYLARWDEFNRVVHDVVVAMGGSIAAEHGIGQLKPDELARVKSPVALKLMRAIKTALDPDDVLNPGKVLPAAASRDR